MGVVVVVRVKSLCGDGMDMYKDEGSKSSWRLPGWTGEGIKASCFLSSSSLRKSFNVSKKASTIADEDEDDGDVI